MILSTVHSARKGQAGLVGLYVFAEQEALERQEQLYFAVGLVGGALVALSFSEVLSRRSCVGQPCSAHVEAMARCRAA